MPSFVQSVDPVARLSSDRDLPFPETLSVTELEVERVFGGGGSKATVDIILDGFLTREQQEAFEEAIRPEENAVEGALSSVSGALDLSKVEEDEDFLDGLSDSKFVTEQQQQYFDITLEVAVAVTDPTDPNRSISNRLFTGTLTKIEESHDRTITLHALDRRLHLNRNSVFLDADDNRVDELVRNVLSASTASGNGSPSGLQLTEGEDFFIDLEDEPEVVKDGSWGVESHATVFEFLQDMARFQGATIHVDRYNRLHFISDVPETSHVWLPDGTQVNRENTTIFGGVDSLQDPAGLTDMTMQMPPIIEWKSSQEENQTQTIAETTYDETGLGTYAVTSQDVLEAAEAGDYVSRSIKENNVISRSALENVIETEMFADSLMRDSGTIRFTGDPRVRPYDMFTLNDRVVNAFAPISGGTYMTKTVRHILNTREGYITEVELGTDPEELFEEFTRSHGTNTVIEGPDDEVTEEDDDSEREFREPAHSRILGQDSAHNPNNERDALSVPLDGDDEEDDDE